MKWYLSARFSRAEEINDHADSLRMLGDAVSSRWHEPSDEDRESQSDERREELAIGNMEDVVAADGIIAFTEAPRKAKGEQGGRHAEFGLALGLNKRLIIVGPRENTFHYLPMVEQYDTWQEFLDMIAKEIEE